MFFWEEGGVLELLKMADFGQIQRFFVLIDPPAIPKFMNQGDPMHLSSLQTILWSLRHIWRIWGNWVNLRLHWNFWPPTVLLKNLARNRLTYVLNSQTDFRPLETCLRPHKPNNYKSY